MKRNMVPFMGIAFVVAIVCTGIWYGLLAGKLRSSSDVPGHAIVVAARDLDRGTVIQSSDLRVVEAPGMLAGGYTKTEEVAGATLLTSLKANEPLLEERVAPRSSDRSAGPVPAGMRAVTLHVYQSESLLGLLHSGSRVDLQAVSEKNGSTELRTVRENVEVLAAGDNSANRQGSAAVTVLLRAQDSDVVALADSGSRIRVALRNPLDEATTPSHALALADVFSGSKKLESGALESAQALNTAWDHPIQLQVRVLNVSDAALEELRSASSEITTDNSWRVAAFHSSDAAQKLIQSLEQKQQAEVVSSERLMAGVGRPISFRTGPKSYELRLQFAPETLASGKVGLWVKPQLGPHGAGSATKKYEAGLPDASSFLVGFGDDSTSDNAPAKLFPERSWDHKHLVIFVSTRKIQLASQVAVARSDRGR
jgi:Flp pilus assembly protein CpaB